LNYPHLLNKRILQIVPSLNSGGVERTVLDIAQAIIKAGGQAIVATSGGRMVQELETMGASVLLLPLASKNPFVMWQNISRLQDIKADIIHARSRAPAWSAYYAAKRTHTPFITTYHGIYSGGSGLKELYNRIMVKGMVTIANSNFTREHILATHKNVKDVRVVNRGVDITRFSPRPAAQNEVFTFLMPARVVRGKGFELLFEALGLLKTPCLVQVVGDGRESNYGQTLKAPANVIFRGHSSDMAASYAHCDAVLIPATRPEAFGRIAIEAGAMGKIAISSNIGGMRETIVHEQTGFHFETGNAQQLAEVLEKVMHLSLEEKIRIQTAARVHIAQNYSLTQCQEKTLAIYNEILKT
jgi:glycosyltransferase involved in cell wall biosynthesis